jgi:ABC-type antimicrobial peptide transport system permease subunit
MMLRDGLRPTLAGVVVGVAGALALTRFLATLLYGVSASDPLVLAASALSLLLVAVVATYVPARLAARIDPGEILRNE